MSGGLAYATATVLRRDDVPETVGVPLLAGVVGAIVANVRLRVIPDPTADQGTLASFVARQFGGGPTLAAGIDLGTVLITIGTGALAFYWVRERVRVSVENGIRSFLLVLGGIVAFSSAARRSDSRPARSRTSFEPNSACREASCSRSARSASSRGPGWARRGCYRRPPGSTLSSACGDRSQRWCPDSSSPNWPSRSGSQSR